MCRTARGQEHAGGNELPEALRQPAERNDRPDGGDAAGEHVFARKNVREARQRDADEEIADDPGRPGEESQLRIGQAEIMLDALGQHAEHDLIEEDDEGGEHDDKQRPIGRQGRAPARIAVVRNVDRHGLSGRGHRGFDRHAFPLATIPGLSRPRPLTDQHCQSCIQIRSGE